MDAAKSYALMLKKQIAPALRQLGWRGSGQTYRLPNPADDHVLLGFQRSTFNTRDRVEFTMNVSVITRADWEQRWPATRGSLNPPSANSHAGVGWQERVGMLVRPSGDHWWRVWGPLDVDPVCDEVLMLVRDIVQPQVRARLAGSELPPAPAWAWTAPHRGDETDQAALRGSST